MKNFLLILTTFMIITFTGCSTKLLPDYKEIDELDMINAVGLDKGLEDREHIRITVVSKTVEGSQGAGGKESQGSEKARILTKESMTILEASREFQTYSDKRIFWGHVDFYLVGEEAAKEDIAKYLDFIYRDPVFRSSSKIYIIKDGTAEDFIKNSCEENHFMPDHLEAIGENSHLVSGSQELQLLEFMRWLNNKHSCALAPVICLRKGGEDKKKNTEKEREGEEEKEGKMTKESNGGGGGGGEDGEEEGKGENKHQPDIELLGYAYFKDMKLVGYLDKTLSRGENFLLNRIKTSVLHVKSPSGKMVGLDMTDSHTRILPIIKDKELQEILVKIKLSSNIGEVQTSEDILFKDILNFLALQQSNLIKEEVENVIHYAQKNKADFIDMANVVSTKHPVVWSKCKDNWEEIFPDLQIKVEVVSKINRTYDIREPVSTTEEEHK